MISSARISTDCGIVRPRALAVEIKLPAYTCLFPSRS
jgi:hypothetical protein